VVTHQLQVERRTGKVRQSETDVLPLCYDTNWWSGIFSEIVKNKNQQQIIQATVLPGGPNKKNNNEAVVDSRFRPVLKRK